MLARIAVVVSFCLLVGCASKGAAPRESTRTTAADCHVAAAVAGTAGMIIGGVAGALVGMPGEGANMGSAIGTATFGLGCTGKRVVEKMSRVAGDTDNGTTVGQAEKDGE